jgi:uncharacterized damage-inducible protein DinB
MPDSFPTVAALRAVLAQGRALALALDAELYAGPSPLSPHGCVGAHLRHVADFVAAFLRGLERGAIDYDRRERDERLERDPVRAAAHLAHLSRELEPLTVLDPARVIAVRSEESVAGAGWQSSTLGRELVALLSHTIHHYALIAVLLRARGIEPPAAFGVAPSTLAHWQEERTACAPRPG